MHQYQEDAKNFIITHPKCGLFFDMGLGKTLITLSALKELNPTRHVLVIAPKTIARSTWINEIRDWGFNFRWKSLIVNEKQKQLSKAKRHQLYDEFLTTPPSIYFINRELVPDLIDNCPKKNGIIQWPFGIVIIDESQSFKNHASVRFKKLKQVISCSDRVILLSGTPAPKGPIDLWSQIYLLDNGERLGKNITAYRNTFFYESRFANDVCIEWTPKDGAEDEIYHRISDLAISMKNTMLNLPPVIFNDIKVYMTDPEMKIYKTMLKQNVLEVNGQEIIASNAGVLTAKLSQMASGSLYTDPKTHQFVKIHEHKCEYCKHIIENTDSPVLIAYHFVSDLIMLQNYLADNGINAVVFDKTPDMIDKWNRREIPVMLLQPASAGHGINIQKGGHTLIWYTLPWSLEEYLQTNARLYRQGQTESVIIHRLLTDKTVDTRIKDCLTNKDMSETALLNAIKLTMTDIE